MPKFARPNQYTGKQSNENWTGSVRAANLVEAAAGVSQQLYISPATLDSAVGALVDAVLEIPGPIGNITPNSGAFTTLSSTGLTVLGGGAGAIVRVGNATGTIAFFNAAGTVVVTQPTITNSVTAGGTNNTIANYTDLTTYATDAAAIRNNIYQLARGLKIVVDALRGYGLLA